MGRETIASYLQELAKHYEDWQVQQAKEAVHLYRHFKGLPESDRTEQPKANGQADGQPASMHPERYRPTTSARG